MGEQSKQYNGELFRIATKEGERFVPGVTIPECPGLAVTTARFGRFTVTHIATGLRVVPGVYERCDNAIRDTAKLALIAKTHGFSWDCDDPKEKFNAVRGNPVPFEGATTITSEGESPMSISGWMYALCALPWEAIDFMSWEELTPLDEAKKIIAKISELGKEAS